VLDAAGDCKMPEKIYLGKVPDTEAMRWIENIYAQRNREGVEVKRIFAPTIILKQCILPISNGILATETWQISATSGGGEFVRYPDGTSGAHEACPS